MVGPLAPWIVIPLDYSEDPTYSPYPWYALRTDYARIILECGGVPVHLPHSLDCLPAWLDRVDGCLIPGGDYDIDPEVYGASPVAQIRSNPKRSVFDRALIRQLLDRRMPFLGVCAGMQGLNVVCGGSLHQNVAVDLPRSSVQHYPLDQRYEGHGIGVSPGTLLASLVGDGSEASLSFWVNSHHRQAVDRVGTGLRVSALAEDGVIEAIEYEDHPFALGVEWHPEYGDTEQDRAIIRGLVEAANRYRKEKI
jgi:putative glutamine amidotransferase